MATNQDDDTDFLDRPPAAPAQPTIAGAPLVPGVIAPGNPMFPELEVRHKDGPDITTTTSKPTLAPEQIQAIEGRKALSADEKTIADQQFKQDQAMHAIETQGAQMQAEEAKRHEAERNALDLKTQADVDQWSQHLRQARDRYESMPLPSLFGDKTTGRQVLMGVGLALGALGSAASAQANARLGGGGQAPDAVGDIIKSDLDRQRQNIKEMSDRVVMAKAGVDDAVKARQLLLADVDVRGAVAYKKIQSIVQANLASQKMSQDEIARHQAYQNADKNAQEYQEKAVAGLTETHTTAAQQEADSETRRSSATGAKQGGQGVEADKNAAHYDILKQNAEWIADNIKGMDPADIAAANTAFQTKMIQRDHPAISAVGSLVGLDPESGLTPKAKELLDHAMRASEHYGRLESGGAITGGENFNFNELVGGAKTSDTAETRAMRAKNMMNEVNAMGRYFARPGRNTDGSPSPALATPSDPQPAFLSKPVAPSTGNSVRNLTPSAVPQTANPDDPNAANASRPLEEDAGAEELPPATKATLTTKTFQGKAGNHAPAAMQPMKAPVTPATLDIPRTLTPAKLRFIEQAKKEHFMPPPSVLKQLGLTQEDFD